MVVTQERAGMIVERLELGQRVALVVSQARLRRQALEDVLAVLEDEQLDGAKIRRSAGAERLELASGGRLTIHLASTSYSLRGLSLDAIYWPISRDVAEGVHPCLARSGGSIFMYEDRA